MSARIIAENVSDIFKATARFVETTIFISLGLRAGEKEFKTLVNSIHKANSQPTIHPLTNTIETLLRNYYPQDTQKALASIMKKTASDTIPSLKISGIIARLTEDLGDLEDFSTLNKIAHHHFLAAAQKSVKEYVKPTSNTSLTPVSHLLSLTEAEYLPPVFRETLINILQKDYIQDHTSENTRKTASASGRAHCE